MAVADPGGARVGGGLGARGAGPPALPRPADCDLARGGNTDGGRFLLSRGAQVLL